MHCIRFRASPLSHSELQGRAPPRLRLRLGVVYAAARSVAGAGSWIAAKQAAVNELNIYQHLCAIDAI